jgi:hypothetical protein
MTTPRTAERPQEERVIPRLEEETARAHAMKVAYVTMGPNRSLEKLRQRYDKNTSYIRQLAEWSSQFDWQATARAWDDQQAAAVARDASESYRRDLEDHRKRYGDMGKALYQVAAKMLKKLDASVATMEATPQTLAIASRAVTIAADLEAHALRLGDILPKLDHDVQD